MSERDPQPVMAGAVDPDQPWLGLDSFSEQTRAYFYGRDDEIGELARRVQRKTLTILFGQSGLGKTSILRAGLVPRLRPEGYCPVYVRISYGDDAPAPAAQIKQAILRAAEALGSWTRAGAARDGESLWEFLHHRDDQLLDADGRPLIPLLIFDQFEEVFTIGQTDDAGKRRAAQFLAELADLAENRPPQALETRIDADDALAEAFDFAREDYRILISLREDYLAHLESLRGKMPSVTQNRMRLARMTGAQALSAVIQPGGRLVNEEVAEAIVRFIAGGAELANAEVEPSLLSLICRELNNHRIAQGRAEISTDLLAGSHAGILSEFYQRALRDMPDGVHVLIEDQLLTEAGYRENLAEERVLAAFATASAPAGALATLVNRRLLRIEERLDVRRVELTHDVLCGVVKAAREQRRERLEKEAALEQLRQHQEEQRRARRKLVHARKWAAAGVALAVVAVAAGAYAYISAQRAAQTRSEAEKLVAYLLDDYYEELRPVGRADLIGELGSRAVAYYQELPEGMRNAEAERNQAVATLRLGIVKTTQGDFDAASPLLKQALAVLNRLYEDGDHSERARMDLAGAYGSLSRAQRSSGDIEGGLKSSAQGADFLRPLVKEGKASAAALRVYARIMDGLGWCQLRLSHTEQALAALREARAALSFAAQLKDDMPATVAYINASGWLYEALVFAGQPDQAREVAAEVLRLADQVLEQRPGYFDVLRAKSHVLSVQILTDTMAHRITAATRAAQQNLQASEELLRIDRKTENAWSDLSISYSMLRVPYWQAGRVQAALDALQRGLDIYRDRKPSAYQQGNLSSMAWVIGEINAERGDEEGMKAAWRLAWRYTQASFSEGEKAWGIEERARLGFKLAEMDAARVLGREVPLEAVARLRARAEQYSAEKTEGGLASLNNEILRFAWRLEAQLALQAGQYERAAACSVKSAQAAKDPLASYTSIERPTTPLLVQALALAHLHRDAEAQALIAPLIAKYRKLVAEGTEDQYVKLDLATGLLASALSDQQQRAAQLKEAQALLASLPAEMQQLRSVLLWKQLVAQAAGGRG